MWPELIAMKITFHPNGSHSGRPIGWKKVKTSVAPPAATESTRRLRISGSRNAVPASRNARWPHTSDGEIWPSSGRWKRRRIASPTALRTPPAAALDDDEPAAAVDEAPAAADEPAAAADDAAPPPTVVHSRRRGAGARSAARKFGAIREDAFRAD